MKSLGDAENLIAATPAIFLARSGSRSSQILRAKMLGYTLSNDMQISLNVLFLDLGSEEIVKVEHIWSAPEEIRFIPPQVI